MKTGILGGTFDPIHQGHLDIAEVVRRRLGLESVWFVPAGQPWLRTDVPVLPAEHRVQMVRLAIAGRSCFVLSTVEIERAGPTYTVDTASALREKSTDEFYFILGWDSLAQLPRWHQPAWLIQMCRLVVVPRPGYPAPDMESLEAAVPGLSERVVLLDEPRTDIGATEIRERVRQGLPIAHLVPEPVAIYIEANGLYL